MNYPCGCGICFEYTASENERWQGKRSSTQSRQSMNTGVSQHRPFAIPAVIAAMQLILLCLVSFNCIKQPPPAVAPTWDVSLTFPISTKAFSLEDFVRKDSSSLRVDQSNRLVFCISQKTPCAAVGDRICITPETRVGNVQLGSFMVVFKPATINLTVPSLPVGQTQPFPSMSMIASGAQIATGITGSVTLKSGLAEFTLHNNLPVAILLQKPVEIVDLTGVQVAAFDFGGIAISPHQSRTVSRDLSGSIINGDLTIGDLEFSTPGSVIPVTMPSDSLIIADFKVGNLRVSSVENMVVPAQRLIDNARLPLNLNDSTIIQSAVVKSGVLRFQFTSHINDGLLFKYRLEEVYRNVSGQLVQYEDSVFLPALGGGVCEVDLAGDRFLSRTGMPLNAVDLTSSVIFPTATPGSVNLHDTDKVEVQMRAESPIIADSISGVLKPMWMDFSSTVPFVKGDFFSKFKAECNIPLATLTWNTSSSIGFPADLYVRISGRRPTGEVVTLDLPPGSRRIQPGLSSVSFDGAEVGRFLSQFSGAFPESLTVTGQALVNPPDCYNASLANPGRVGRNCAIDGFLDFNLPMTIGITQATYRDTTSFGVDDQNNPRKPGQDDLKSIGNAKFIIDLANNVPARMNVRVHILDHEHRVILTLPQNGQMLSVPAAAVDAGGLSVVPSQSRLILDLSRQEALQYIPAEFVDYETEIETSAGSTPVVFRTTDALSVRLWTECTFGINR